MNARTDPRRATVRGPRGAPPDRAGRVRLATPPARRSRRPTADSAPTTASSSRRPPASPSAPACTAVPKDGKGSFNGMATDPVATAASNNPVLSTLVTAVKAAGLVDTLNSAPAITVFAPTNDAFAKIPANTLNKGPRGQGRR